MATGKYIDRICCVVTVFSLLLTILFMHGKVFGVQPSAQESGYSTRLFDSNRVHTLDIVMDDWDSFLATCQSEEYSACSVMIDGESYKNVGIRGKGNTSLSSVSAMGSSRYSFKIEFDKYDSAKSYYGLDKLSLNNLIQDNTMMKDYLTYQMMNNFGVPSSLCSFVYITVNGEEWGLYLAVEGVEEAFLQRNYGKDYGELYKPDSMSFGGGRGNGRDFDMNDFANASDDADGDASAQRPDFGNFTPPAMPNTQGNTGENSSAGQNTSQWPPNAPPDGVTPPGNFDPSSAEQGATQWPSNAPPEDGVVPGDFDPSSMPGGGEGGFSFGGSSDVKLQYIDDDPESYSNIFDNAKTDISKADQKRLISSLKTLSSFTDLENVLDINAVLRYFVVHNFVVNGDSYTGNMIHNYYLYEKDGKLSMIPWDYNLAFGTFTGGVATSSVNSAIDDVLSDRPMQAWIFSDEAYTKQYHELYSEFLNTVDSAQIIDDAYALIADYVEKDPTKFCTYEEFETGVQTLKSFCSLRQESIQGQLSGTIPATSTEQNANSEALVNADNINLSDMGTMNNGQGGGPGGFGGPGGGNAGTFAPEQVSGEERTDPSQPTESMDPSQAAGATGPSSGSDASSPPQGMRPPDFQPDGPGASKTGTFQSALLLGGSVLVLIAGVLFAKKFKCVL